MASAEGYPNPERIENYQIGQQFPSICPYCAGGCGVLVTTLNDEVIETEGDPIHPINEGALCSKATAYLQLINNDRRIKKPMKRTNPIKGENVDPMWEEITWEEVYNIIAQKVKDAMENVPYKRLNSTTGKDDYYYVGKDSPIAWLGSSYWNNEECYLGKKLISLLGSTNVEHQARKCHASTVVALANTYGFGAMTNHIIDAKNSKVFLIVSNPAESHSMEFRWVTRAIENKNAKVIVLDPRFNRTGSKADIYVRYRSGSEAAIFLGLIKYTIENGRYDKDFLETRTTTPYDLNGNFLSDWETNPDSIFSKLKAIVNDYDPNEVYRISGIPPDKFELIADTFTDLNNRPGNIYYAMGTTQHTNATQAIRAHAILQLLLGNMGKPGGGVNALRGISNVQGSTDQNLLAHVIMGYREQPNTKKWYSPSTVIEDKFVDQIRRYQKWKNSNPSKRGGVSGGTIYPWPDQATAESAGMASLWRWDDRMFTTWNALEYHWGIYIGTWPGIDPDNEPIVCDLPVGFGNFIVQIFRAIEAGLIKVIFINAENPAVSMPNAYRIRKDALAKEGLFVVVNEIFETETAVYADILLPGTVQVERSGSITNTGRWIQWRWKAVDPPGECKQELQYLTELFERLREDAGIKVSSEMYEVENAVSITKNIGGVTLENNPDNTWPSSQGTDAESVYKEMCAKAIGVGDQTLEQSAANRIYMNGWDPALRPDLDGILAKRRDITPVDANDEEYGYFKNWAFSWMLNQRVLYNLGEGTTPTFKFFTWWAHSDTKWLGWDKAAIWSRPLYDTTKSDWNPLKHGLPKHNEPLESPDAQLKEEYPSMWDEYAPALKYEVTTGSSEDYPYVLTTFRLAEHMQAGAMTRNLSWLVELQPEMFIEISQELASELGVKSGDYVIVKTARSVITNPNGERMRCIVTERIKPLTINGNTVHEVSMPWHWGFKGLSTGPSANVLTIDAVDVSAHIPEYKACLCKVEKA
ncbi:MAG: molybdopterin-dependent oxidoreductase [archaeon]|nr:molybdopterin-dependent oxidoreductase [archaeon]